LCVALLASFGSLSGSQLCSIPHVEALPEGL
jgi:hypothetical protein